MLCAFFFKKTQETHRPPNPFPLRRRQFDRAMQSGVKGVINKEDAAAPDGFKLLYAVALGREVAIVERQTLHKVARVVVTLKHVVRAVAGDYRGGRMLLHRAQRLGPDRVALVDPEHVRPDRCDRRLQGGIGSGVVGRNTKPISDSRREAAPGRSAGQVGEADRRHPMPERLHGFHG